MGYREYPGDWHGHETLRQIGEELSPLVFTGSGNLNKSLAVGLFIHFGNDDAAMERVKHFRDFVVSMSNKDMEGLQALISGDTFTRGAQQKLYTLHQIVDDRWKREQAVHRLQSDIVVLRDAQRIISEQRTIAIVRDMEQFLAPKIAEVQAITQRMVDRVNQPEQGRTIPRAIAELIDSRKIRQQEGIRRHHKERVALFWERVRSGEPGKAGEKSPRELIREKQRDLARRAAEKRGAPKVDDLDRDFAKRVIARLQTAGLAGNDAASLDKAIWKRIENKEIRRYVDGNPAPVVPDIKPQPKASGPLPGGARMDGTAGSRDDDKPKPTTPKPKGYK